MPSGAPTPRRLVLSRQLRVDPPILADEELLILPNRQAARSQRVPYRSLEGLAKKLIGAKGLGLAPKLISHRLLRRAAARAGGDDPVGMARAAEGTIRQLLRAGVDLQALQRADNPRVARLASIASFYRQFLAEQGLVDAAELLWRAAELEPERVLLQLRGFPRLPAPERAFLDVVAAPGSIVHLPVAAATKDVGEAGLFAENLEAVEEFRARGWLIEESPADEAGLGAGLGKVFLGLARSEERSPKSVGCYAYPDADAEVRGTLAAVKRLLSSGAGPDTIAIVARSEESYGDAMLAVADEYGLPLRVLYQVPLAQTRFGAWLGELVEAIHHDLPFEATARLLAHPLVDALEADVWSEARSKHTGGWQAWEELLPALGESWPVSAVRGEFIERLESLLGRLGVPDNALRWAREASALSSFFDELRALPGQQREVTTEGFASDVGELVRLLTVPAQPGRGGVELHTPLSLFGARVDHLFVVGAAEGVLPGPVRPDPLLDPFEREELRAAGYPIEDVSQAALREELSFWALLHAVGESLTISYPRLLGRRESLPSPYLARLDVTPRETAARPICSPQELRRARLRSDERFDGVLERARRSQVVESRRESAEPFDGHDGLVGFPYLPPSGGLAVTGLISLASCPFKFFGERILRLAEQEEAADNLEPSLRGRLFHQVLQLVMERAREAAEPRAAALAALDEAFAVAEEELGLNSLASWHLERGQHLATLRRAISAPQFLSDDGQVRELERSFRAVWRGIPVRGRVDRIDGLPQGLEFLDYKSGGSISNLAKDQYGRAKVDLQLTIYREAAAEALTPGEPVAGSRYFSITRAEDLRAATPAEEELERIAADAKLAWREGSYPVDPDIDGEACRYCPLDPVCRKGPRLERKRSRK